jgi:hypothetical protein
MRARSLRLLRSLLALLAVLSGLALVSRVAVAEPYIAIQQGYKCIQCHVNPTGGGLRTTFGDVFAENVLPAKTLPPGSPVWTGQVVQDIVRIGGDLRTDWSRTTEPQAPTVQAFALEQARVYADVSVIPNLLGVYVDEQIAPGTQTMEAYLRYGDTSNWYLKAGHFYLPFGWRLQDQTAFVREVTGVNMNTPDTGVEFGLERQHLEWQFDITNGAANTSSTTSTSTSTGTSTGSSGGEGYMLTTQLLYTQSIWRIGAAGAHTQSNVAGNRDMSGLFAGLRTGPVAWLGEVDVVRQAGYSDGTHTMVPMLGEMDWEFLKGSNLKLTYEFYDPDVHVAHNQETRWSALYELTPIPFLQIRTGYRRYQGIPQDNAQNETLAFVEAHGFF